MTQAIPRSRDAASREDGGVDAHGPAEGAWNAIWAGCGIDHVLRCREGGRFWASANLREGGGGVRWKPGDVVILCLEDGTYQLRRVWGLWNPEGGAPVRIVLGRRLSAEECPTVLPDGARRSGPDDAPGTSPVRADMISFLTGYGPDALHGLIGAVGMDAPGSGPVTRWAVVGYDGKVGTGPFEPSPLSLLAPESLLGEPGAPKAA